MGFLKRLFGKKDEKKQTERGDEKKMDAKKQPVQDTESKTATAAKTEPSAKEKHRKYHVSLNRDENSEKHMMWRVRLEQSDKTIKHFKTQEEAIEFAENLADDSGASVVIHKKDGTIRRQNYKKHS